MNFLRLLIGAAWMVASGSGIASAAPSSTSIAGIWNGSYVCTQGLTKLELRVTRNANSSFSAIFAFSAHPSNPSVPSGSYSMLGSYNELTGRFVLYPQRWISQPPGWLMVGLDGTVRSTPGLVYDGNVTYPGCTTFGLQKGGSGGPTSGRDNIVGTPGPDVIDALAGNDSVTALGGDDIVIGNVGVDQMWGGKGRDRFRYWGDAVRGYHSGVGAGKRDRIMDFVQADDLIDLAGVDANALAAGNQTFQLIGGAQFLRPGQVRWQRIGNITLIQANTDADLKPEFEIELSNPAYLTSVSFLP